MINHSAKRPPGAFPRALRGLPRGVRILVSCVTGCYLLVVIWAGVTMRPDTRAALTLVAFTAAALLSVELSMRLAWPRARRDRMSRDFLGVWMLPVALLLPPQYIAIMVLAPMVYLQARIWRRDPVKFSYSVAVLGLSYAAASGVVRAITSSDSSNFGWDIGHGSASRQVVAVAAAVVVWWLINYGLVAGVVVLTSGRDAITLLVRNREGYLLDAVDCCAGGVATALWLSNPFLLALLVPPVLLMQHQLFSGLRQAVRTDLLTEAANPQVWREIAARENERATASGANLSVLMMDIDHFKLVNDQHGHLAGDEVLAAVARTISKALRPGDLVGRLGGEEFGAILAGQNLLDAQGAAERVREQVEESRVRSDRGEWIGVTVSVGVAELSVSGGTLRQLLDAADRALYAAKAAGRNRVRLAGPRASEIIDLTAARHPAALDR